MDITQFVGSEKDWCEEEVKALIFVWKDKYEVLETHTTQELQRKIYGKIASSLQNKFQSDTPRAWSEVRDKICNLKHQYRSEKKIGISNASTWSYFDLLSSFLRLPENKSSTSLIVKDEINQHTEIENCTSQQVFSGSVLFTEEEHFAVPPCITLPEFTPFTSLNDKQESKPSDNMINILKASNDPPVNQDDLDRNLKMEKVVSHTQTFCNSIMEKKCPAELATPKQGSNESVTPIPLTRQKENTPPDNLINRVGASNDSKNDQIIKKGVKRKLAPSEFSDNDCNPYMSVEMILIKEFLDDVKFATGIHSYNLVNSLESSLPSLSSLSSASSLSEWSSSEDDSITTDSSSSNSSVFNCLSSTKDSSDEELLFGFTL